MKVYLAGGLRSGWRDEMPKHENIIYVDPRVKDESKMSMDMIAAWDFLKIQQSDVVFAYMERTNPSGFGLSVEIGYAFGIGKTVILVLEKDHQYHKDRYLEFITKAANVTFNNFLEGSEFLLELAK